MTSTQHPATPHPTYGFAVLSGITLGMAERGEISVRAARGGGRGDTQGVGGSTHGLAVPARGSVLPRWPRGTGDLFHHRAIGVLREGPGGTGLTRLPFLALGARVAKSSTALREEGNGDGWHVPKGVAQAGMALPRLSQRCSP